MSRVSIKDVAEQAGVSTATVSHVINGTRFVRDDTRQRVLDAIEALNYQPNAIARGLATNSTQTVGLLVSDIMNPFFTAVVRGVEDEIAEHGYHTIFCNTSENPQREDQYLKVLSGRQIDGLIMAPTGEPSERLNRIADAGTPIVLVDRATPGIDAPLVTVNNENGAFRATRYLIELGHRRIAALMGPHVITSLRDRLNGYRRALKEADIAINEDYVVQADPLFFHNIPYGPVSFHNADLIHPEVASVQEALNTLFNLSEQPTAIFITNNQQTLAALVALKERGLRCPEDISIISFDDHVWAPMFTPALTVIRQPTHQIGREAARLMMQMVNEQPITNPEPFEVELIKRESCRPL